MSLTLLYLVIGIFSSFVVGQQLEHGAVCDINDIPDKCNQQKFLQCSIDGFCECRDPLNTYYNNATRICQSLSGVPCGSGRPNCIANSACTVHENGGARCVCSENFAPNRQRRCFHPFGHQGCNALADNCDTGLGYQKCNAGVCGCALPATAWYNARELQCQLKVDSSCHPTNISQPCVPFSQCDPNIRRCQCESDLVGNAEGLCYLSHGADCDILNDMCDKDGYLKCKDNPNNEVIQPICSCDPTESSVYDTVSRSCKIRALSNCSPEPEAQKCVANSDCLPTAGEDVWKCRCNGDLEPNRNNQCFLRFGKRCEVSDRLCDPAAYLECSSNYNVCICDIFSQYDNKSGTCLKSLGRPCSGNIGEQPCLENAFCNNGYCTCKAGFVDTGSKCIGQLGSSCGSSAECSVDDHLICLQGRCECMSGYWQEGVADAVGNISQKCVAGYLELCTLENDECSPAAGLKCLNSQCQCLAPGEQVYQTNIRKCGTLAGGRCHLVDEGEDLKGVLKCVENADCIRTNSSLPGYGTCTCQEYWLEIDGKCIEYSGATRFSDVTGVHVLISAAVFLFSASNIFNDYYV